MADGAAHLILFEVLVAELKTDGSSLDFPAVELEAGVVVVAVVNLDSDSSGHELVSNLLSLVLKCRLVIILVENGDDNDLSLGNLRRQHNTSVV